MTTLLSELAALEQSTDPEKREVGARLRTAIRNVLSDIAAELKASYELNGYPDASDESVARIVVQKNPPFMLSDDCEWNYVGDIEGGGHLYIKPSGLETE